MQGLLRHLNEQGAACLQGTKAQRGGAKPGREEAESGGSAPTKPGRPRSRSSFLLRAISRLRCA